MRDAVRILTFVAASAALIGCNGHAPQNEAGNQDIAIEDNLSSQGQMPSNAQIETLPADESSATPSGQLQNGYDKPDVNDLGNSD